MKSLLTDNSLFDRIANSVVKDANGDDVHLPENFRLPELPDEKLAKFADGAIDGIYIYHTQHHPISDEAKALLVKAMKAVGKGNREEAQKLFEELGQKARAISIIDELQTYILEHKETVPAEKAFKYAIYAAFNSKDRETVKFALSMLELLQVKDDTMKEMLRVLGLSDEFTIFVIFIMQQWEKANEEIFRLARKTSGWGRIHAVERLIPETPEIRDWLLHEGIDNQILPSYSSLNCWEGSEAENLLFGDQITPKEFAAIGRIIAALLDEGPCPGISELERGDEIVKAYLVKGKSMPHEAIDKKLIGSILDIYGGTDKAITKLARAVSAMVEDDA